MRRAVTSVPGDGITIIATGPLTNDAGGGIARLTGSDRLYFYTTQQPHRRRPTIDIHRIPRIAMQVLDGQTTTELPFDKPV